MVKAMEWGRKGKWGRGSSNWEKKDMEHRDFNLKVNKDIENQEGKSF